jgi:hypothetical protein
MIATLVSFISHSQVWALQEGSSVYIAGRSNRAFFEFEGELERILEKVPELGVVEKVPDKNRALPGELPSASSPSASGPVQSSPPAADGNA